MNKPILIENSTIVNEGKSLNANVIVIGKRIQEIGTTESKAAVAGGVTSFINMPNTVSHILSVKSLNEKYEIASKKSLANYAFFLVINGKLVYNMGLSHESSFGMAIDFTPENL